MALRAWFPLNNSNSYANLGTSGATATVENSGSWNTPGKVSPVYWRSGRFYFSYPYHTTGQMSIALWIYPDSPGAWASIFGWGSNGNRIEKNADTNYYYFGDGTNGLLANSTSLNISMPNGIWYHFAMVADGTNVRFYLNGNLTKTVTQKNTLTTSFGTKERINIGGYEDFYAGRYNDVRVYDHALSLREVKELARGLAVHYTLDNPYTNGILNKYSGTASRGDLGGSFTKTKLANEEGYKFTYTRTGDGTNVWPMIYGGNIAKANFAAGGTYVWSCRYRINKWTAGYMDIRNACWTNDYTNGGVQFANPSSVDGKWHTAYRVFTITQSIYDNANFAPRFELCCSNLNSSGTVYDFDIDLKEIQIIAANTYAGWVYNDFRSASVQNVAAGGHTPLTVSGTMPMVPSAAYLAAYNFNNTGYLYKNLFGMSFTQFTMSYWFKPKDISSKTRAWFVGAFDNWSNNGIGIYRDGATCTTLRCIMRDSSASSYGNLGGATFTLNAWHHLAITWTGTVAKVFLDGTLKTTVTYGSGGSVSMPSLSLGNSRYGSYTAAETEDCAMSDFRLYATALADNEVVSLYNTPACISRTGGLHAYEVREEPVSGVSVGRNGVVTATAFVDQYRVEPDGSRWVLVALHANPKSGNMFSSSDSFSTFVYKDSSRYFNGKICDHVNRWEFLAIQKANSTAAIDKFRWIQSKSPNTASFADTTSANVTKITNGYSTTAYGGIYKLDSNTYYVANNGTSGSWYGAMGCWTVWNNGLPGWNSTAVVDGGYLMLYIRMDGGATWNYTQEERVSFVKANGSVSEAEIVEN